MIRSTLLVPPSATASSAALRNAWPTVLGLPACVSGKIKAMRVRDSLRGAVRFSDSTGVVGADKGACCERPVGPQPASRRALSGAIKTKSLEEKKEDIITCAKMLWPGDMCRSPP
jgi:hypothetical protein